MLRWMEKTFMIIQLKMILKQITTGQGDDYIPGCLLDYNYFDKIIT